MLQTVSLTIKGIVQGVFYRQMTKEIAIQKGITGEVKNLPDRSVHIIATGTEQQLQELIDWCKKGPARAVVSDIAVEKIPLQSFPDFKVTR
ncbi:MAG: acylphosphatase [Chitinophagaceae bacterium]